MASLNKIQIIGNIGKDPEISYTQSGLAVAKISVATTETWNDKATGEKREQTEWHRVTFFGKQAETIGKYIKKGSSIYVEGKLKTDTYEKDGRTVYSTGIIASNFQFLGGRQEPKSGQQSGQFQQPGQFNQQRNQYNSPPPPDDISF